MSPILCLDDFEEAARAFLPPVFQYIAGAAETNASLAGNRSSFDRYRFVPRVLVDVTHRSTSAPLLGETYAAPFGIAPLGLSALFAYRGDIVMAQAAAQHDVPMIMSGSSLIRLEEVITVNPRAWFQAYLPGDMGQIEALLDRVAAARFQTLVVTVDTPVAANRENNARAGFTTPLRPTPRLAWQGVTRPQWLFGTFLKTIARHGVPHFENNYATRGAPILSKHVLRDFSDRGHLTWKHFCAIRRHWKGKLVIKGVLHADDARAAADAGADGIIVSNHGGRQLDGAASPLDVLPSILAVRTGLPVMLDGGVRRGTDALKALALGASFVFVGRPFGYATAVGGLPGLNDALGLLKEEISRDMAMLGIRGLVIDALRERVIQAH
ncbi:MAG: alpha-hydroxy-acid oxidizing protein [Proteobacteria bacterium]|nr:alpha-hydroxy-acid oxidizing protein [Pseudomonadota bacterium]